MRVWAVLSLVGVAGVAAASFDMLLFLDGTADRIYRFDPINNVNLGSFTTSGDAQSLLVDQASATAYTISFGSFGWSLQRYNIWTGALVSEVAIGGSFNDPNGFGFIPKLAQGAPGEGLLSLYGGVQRLNLATGALIGSPYAWSSSDFSYARSRAAYLSNGEYVTPGESDGSPWVNDRVMLFNSVNNWQASYVVDGVASASSISDIVAKGNRLLVSTYDGNSSSLYMLQRSSGSLTSARIGTNQPSRQFVAAEWGHTTEGYLITEIADAVAGPYFFRRFSTVSGDMAAEIALNGYNRIDSTAIFLAPEPGTVAALGVGIAALIRRRRGQSAPQ